MLAREIRTALRSSLGPGVDNAKLTKAIDRAVDDPKFVGAFEDAIVNVNRGRALRRTRPGHARPDAR